MQYLTFFIAGEEYAIGILRVTEIIECGAMTKVPSTPQWIRGVLNLRGAVVPVVDLAVKFGLDTTELTARTCVVVMEMQFGDERVAMGVMADAVNQVVELSDADIQPAPPFGPKVRVDYLLGMGRSGEKFVLLLDIDRVLAASEILAALEAPQQQELEIA